jgi:hypothetical protein
MRGFKSLWTEMKKGALAGRSVTGIRSTSEATDPRRKIDFDHGSDRDCLPLQAADILVNETYRYMRNKYQNAETAKTLPPALGAAPAGTADERARYIIEALKPNCLFMVRLYNKGALEIILDGKASGTIRPDGFNVEAIPLSAADGLGRTRRAFIDEYPQLPTPSPLRSPPADRAPCSTRAFDQLVQRAN